MSLAFAEELYFDLAGSYRSIDLSGVLEEGGHYWPDRDDDTPSQILDHAATRLGSIAVTGAVICIAGYDVSSFWIETAEGNRRRVFAAELCGQSSSSPLTSAFAFSPDWIASCVVAQY
jgi:hypothetical protein